MRAYRMQRAGQKPDWVDIDRETPGPGQVGINIRACGLNFADLLMIAGKYQDVPPLPFTLGMELSGTVAAIGSGVTSVAPGERVALVPGSGGMAEYGVFAQETILKIPQSMSFEQAAGFQIAYGTSHLALVRRARLAAGETLLVLGAAGGVGLTAVELGKALGARVIAVARGAQKLAAAAAAGADHLIDSDKDDIRAEVKALGGADVVYDPVGGDQFTAAMRACNPEARILAIGFASGDVPQIPANILMVKNIDVIGFYWGGYLRFSPAALTNSMKDLFALFEAGQLAPHIGQTYPFEQAQDALDLLASRKSTGKIVVTMPAPDAASL